MTFALLILVYVTMYIEKGKRHEEKKRDSKIVKMNYKDETAGWKGKKGPSAGEMRKSERELRGGRVNKGNR